MPDLNKITTDWRTKMSAIRRFGRWSVFLGVMLWELSVWAHDPSKSYLNLVVETNRIVGQWDIPLSDLQSVVPLTNEKDGALSWDKLRDHYPQILAYAQAHLHLSADGTNKLLRFPESEPTIEDFRDGAYLELSLEVDDLGPWEVLEINYELFFETNSLHRGLLRFESLGKTQSAVFSPEKPVQRLRAGVGSSGEQFLLFLKEGVSHIWTGYDHILFLLALLLPAVLTRGPEGWREVTAFRPAGLNVFKIVTAFTLAHSLTLSLATLQIVRLPSRLTESAIALSVALAALNNLRPMIRERGWLVAFGFGLIHGFGFANALSELGLTESGLLLVLVGFNLGVEIGQLAIVAVFLPLAYAVRQTWFYQKPALHAGSCLIIAVALAWLTERVLDLKFMPF